MTAETPSRFANPLSDPRHWSKSRDARTPDELDELLAWTFTPVEMTERYMLVSERHPDLVAAVQLVNALPSAEYLRHRAAAIRVRELALPDPALVRDVDAAANAFRALAAPRLSTSEGFRAAMATAFAVGSFADLSEAFLRWTRAARAGLEHRRTVAALRGRLAFGIDRGPRVGPTEPGDFASELVKAAAAAAVIDRRSPGQPDVDDDVADPPATPDPAPAASSATFADAARAEPAQRPPRRH